MALLKVGELARHTGLTVRTLHHYDEIGLLKPSGRSDAGYRLYSHVDVARLHGIQALRHLGLALGDIAAMLDDSGTSPALIVEQQMRALDREIARASELRGRLELLAHSLTEGDEPGMAAWLDALALMTTYGKYFSAAELKTIFANWKLIEADWQPLIDEVRIMMDKGFASDSLEIQPLVHRWMRLTLLWMGGDFDLIHRWGEMYRNEPSAHGRRGAPQSDMLAFINCAIKERMGLLGKYLSIDEIGRLAFVPEAQWHDLGRTVEQLIEQRVPPGSQPAQDAAGRWLALIDQLTGHDPALRDKLIKAHDDEPLLRAGSPLTDATRSYLRQSVQKGLDPHVT